MVINPRVYERVRVVKNNYNSNNMVGDVGIIVACRSGDKRNVKVLFNGAVSIDREVTAHEDGAAIWFDADELERI